MQNYNLGIFGLVDNGKSTFIQHLTNTKLKEHTLEKQKGMTIKLNVLNFYIINNEITTSPENAEILCNIVDTPGHEILFTKMLTTIELIDLPILLVSPYEKDTDLNRLTKFLNLFSNFNKILIIVSKIDLVTKKELFTFTDNLESILKTYNINYSMVPFSKYWTGYKPLVIENIKNITKIKTSMILDLDFLFLTFKSFNVNKPHTKIKNLIGGILGGVLKKGILNVNDEIYLNFLKNNTEFKSIKTTITRILQNNIESTTLNNDGFCTLETTLDPNLCSNDNLSEIIVSKKQLQKTYKIEIEILKNIDSILNNENVIVCILNCQIKGKFIKDKKNLANIAIEKPIPTILKGINANICSKKNNEWIVKIIGKIL